VNTQELLGHAAQVLADRGEYAFAIAMREHARRVEDVAGNLSLLPDNEPNRWAKQRWSERLKDTNKS
jgi:hypothetical protein